MIYTESAIIDMLYEKLSLPRHAKIISALKPNSIYTINIEDEDFSQIFIIDSEGFKEKVRYCIFKILGEQYIDVDIPTAFDGLDVKLVGKEPIEMHDINSNFENTVITFDCVISATDSPKTYIKSGVAVCPLCYNQQDVKCDFEKKIPVTVCGNKTCKKAKMILTSNKVITDDIQTLFLQELLDRAKHSSPVLLMGKVYGKDVGLSYIGQKKRVTGIFRSIIDMNENENDVYIDILSISDLEDDKEIEPTKEEIVRYRELAKDKNYIDLLINSFAPNVYGMKNIKMSILLQLVGGMKNTNRRSDINILLVGDPSMAKSELLKYAKSITSKSIYTSGRGTSAAGLTIAIVKINDRFVAQAGVLPLCNGGFAFIDEFDKMNKDDRSAMHEAMEQQTASIAKAGIVLTLPTKTTILAAANPRYGAYDPAASLRDNIDIPVPLLARFDLIWLIRDIVNVTEDMMKASHILNSFISSEKVKSNAIFDGKSLMGLLTLARRQQPQLTDDVKNEIIKIYNNMRALATGEDLPVGVRQLEALIRISYALAKLKLKDFVEVEDVLQVKELIELMYNSFNLTLNSGGKQTILGGTARENRQKLAEELWTECENADGNVNLVDFMRKLIENGVAPIDAKKLFGSWERFNHVKLNSDGTYRKA